ncbi:hypothetical protein EMN47_13160 [Prolixibacteraceae bacterium JC049]|nr:hypothetical protein [Prolixibacteraceae bacterium JC049]
MNNYNEIKDIWNQQGTSEMPDVPAQLQNKIAKFNQLVNNAHLITIAVLSLTLVFILVGYFLLFKQHNTISVLAISSMAIALIVRIGMEWGSYRKKQRLDVLSDTVLFANDLSKYYQWRMKMHGLPTWFTVILYVIGVGLLFTQFKIHLSGFWFKFFFIEFWVIALALFYFIRKWIKNELKALSELVETYQGIAM